MPSSTRKRIALIVETSHGSGREILRGIAHHSRQNGNWQLFHGASGLSEAIPDWMEQWDGDAVIARVQNQERLEKLRKLEIPVIDVLGVCENRFPLVHVDDRAIAGQVARYFSQRDFRHFGFYGIEEENWSARRAEGFQAELKPDDSFSLFQSPRDRSEPLEEFRRLQDWLANLPKPVGIMVCSDQRGLELLEACRAEGLAVPEQVSVVGVDNDLALCEISDPPLSSVRGGHFRVGLEAARLCDRLLAGESVSTVPLLVPPNELIERESSRTHAIRDAAVARGIQFIREHLSEPVTNDLIARAVGISRTLFQKRFRDETGQSIREFILLRRIERAKLLIEDSDIPLIEVAERCGFRHQEYLGQVVKKALGMTPGQLRRRAQANSEEQENQEAGGV